MHGFDPETIAPAITADKPDIRFVHRAVAPKWTAVLGPGAVIAAILALVIEALPMTPPTGDPSRDDYWLFRNGIRVAAAAGEPMPEPLAGDEWVFVDRRPFMRKVLGGAAGATTTTVSRPGLSVRAPNAVYELVARAARRRFAGAPLRIVFGYRGLVGDSVVAATPAQRFPAISVRVL